MCIRDRCDTGQQDLTPGTGGALITGIEHVTAAHIFHRSKVINKYDFVVENSRLSSLTAVKSLKPVRCRRNNNSMTTRQSR